MLGICSYLSPWKFFRNQILLETLHFAEIDFRQFGPIRLSAIRVSAIRVDATTVLDLSQGLGGLTPLWCLSTPKFSLTPTILVKNSQKYIADPPLVLPQIEYL